MTTVPDSASVASYLGNGVGAADVESDLAAEVAAQAATCRVAPYTDDLAQALKRRVACARARKGIPLGVQENGLGGTNFVARLDAEVRRLEAPYRRLVMG